jgi:hypothetical protein
VAQGLFPHSRRVRLLFFSNVPYYWARPRLSLLGIGQAKASGNATPGDHQAPHPQRGGRSAASPLGDEVRLPERGRPVEGRDSTFGSSYPARTGRRPHHGGRHDPRSLWTSSTGTRLRFQPVQLCGTSPEACSCAAAAATAAAATVPRVPSSMHAGTAGKAAILTLSRDVRRRWRSGFPPLQLTWGHLCRRTGSSYSSSIRRAARASRFVWLLSHFLSRETT